MYIYDKELVSNLKTLGLPVYYNQFVDDKTAYNETCILRSNEEENHYIKYSVFIWIEGEDPECNDDLYLGAIKFQLDINII